MPKTPEGRAGAFVEHDEFILATDAGATPSQPGGFVYDPALGTGEFVFEDGDGYFNPRTGGGITESQHLALDQLVHALDETHEQIPTIDADGIITSVVAQGVGGGTVIRDYDQGAVDADGLITSARVRQRDAAGVVVETLTAAVSISGSTPTANVVTKT